MEYRQAGACRASHGTGGIPQHNISIKLNPFGQDDSDPTSYDIKSTLVNENICGPFQ